MEEEPEYVKLVKETEIFRNLLILLPSFNINLNSISPGRYEDGKCKFWEEIV